ncbi:hypothetical protein [Companilactobacillus keshanensis]|uniref:DUF5590 domain-containing protein n=1 Tax=Companilactobacillus keshanensis TaxID=2486003 RepID=A0ABW4BRU8_9LACO|nr:hypothetical protein [Companilactobacillus keshanensis]
MNNQRIRTRSEMHRKRKSPKPFYKRIWFIILIVIIALFIIISLFKQEDNNQTKSSESKTEKTIKNYSKVNKSIASKLKMDKGFANGTLDENGKPTDNGTPNNAFAWSNGVVKIKMVDEDRINVHVVTEFKDLPAANKSEVALKAQNIALIGLAKQKKVKQKTYKQGIYTVIFCDGENVGSSKMSNYKEFKWNK